MKQLWKIIDVIINGEIIMAFILCHDMFLDTLVQKQIQRDVDHEIIIAVVHILLQVVLLMIGVVYRMIIFGERQHEW